ncbi:hypothetical protein KI387_023550, partial [Taxus chinensis]
CIFDLFVNNVELVHVVSSSGSSILVDIRALSTVIGMPISPFSIPPFSCNVNVGISIKGEVRDVVDSEAQVEGEGKFQKGIHGSTDELM